MQLPRYNLITTLWRLVRFLEGGVSRDCKIGFASLKVVFESFVSGGISPGPHALTVARKNPPNV